MKTTPQALKRLYEALGGASADVENLSLTPDIIEAIAEVAPTGGGGSVETITLSAEEQMALSTAISAASTAAAAERGVDYTADARDGLSETTFHNILDLYAAGKNVNLQVLFDGLPLVLTPTAHAAVGSGTDGFLIMICSSCGRSGGIVIDARMAFICEYDITDPNKIRYVSSVIVSVCAPKAVD